MAGTSSSPIDLRSDTVTRPSAAMREAMARAEVGDDVYGEDPTVNALQERVAARLGKETALYVPSGSMANQIALRVHTHHGDDVLVGEGSHNMLYESGAAGALSGVQITVIGTGGLYTAQDVEAAIKPDNHHHAPTRLVCVENTHNRGGGRVFPQAEIDRIATVARARGIALHLDGARLLNAEVATGRPAKELAAPFDTVSLCFSKGLGAPVGSVLCGSRALIHRAHRFRKMLGGGMRQAGILAAAALYALEHNAARLADDHKHARLLAETLARSSAIRVDLAAVETNIVNFELAEGAPPAAQVVERAKAKGVLINAIAPHRIRAVTHLDVDGAQCLRAGEILCEAAASGV
jgi:threonine aldolase